MSAAQIAVSAAAKRYRRAGISTVPVCLGGSKRPAAKWGPFQQCLPTEAEIEAWFENGKLWGIAVVCGEVSGNLEIIDFDDVESYGSWQALVEAEAPGLLEKLPVVQTPRPGYQLWYRCVGPVGGNQKLAQRRVESGPLGRPEVRTLIETRGEGGYAVAPGSPPQVHETGRPYTVIAGEPWQPPEIAAEERALLLQCARALDEYGAGCWVLGAGHPVPGNGQQVPGGDHRHRAASTQHPAPSTALRPGDDYNARGSFEELLPRFGWQISHRSGEVVYWRRPGKREGHSATVGAVAPGVLYVFSSNASPFQSGRAYDLFGAYALLEHDGDHRAAARALAAAGYGWQSDAGTRRRGDAETRGHGDGARQAPRHGDAGTWGRGDGGTGREGSMITDTQDREDGRERGGTESLLVIARKAAAGVSHPDHPVDPCSDTPVSVSPRPRVSASASGGLDDATEYGLACRFAAENAGRLRYVSGDQWWLYTAAGAWRHVGKEHAEKGVQDWLAERQRQHPRLTVTRTRVCSVLALAKNLLGPHEMDQFDARDDGIPLRNGVLDLAAGRLLVHAPENLITRVLPYDYDPEAACPRWQQFLAETLLTPEGGPCVEWIELLQEWFGYCLIPSAQAQTSMFWIGSGANGKGVAERVLGALVGADQVVSLNMDRLHEPYHLAQLCGKLVGVVNEIDRRAMTRNGQVFKAIVGGDQLSARRPAECVFEFRPFLRVVVSCNALPATDDLSHGYFRRIVMIEWRRQLAEEEQDTNLDETLRGELPGILNWALAGLRRFRERGNRLLVPAASRRLLEEYRHSEDSLAQFLEERCVLQPDAMITAARFYGAYEVYCQANGLRAQSGTAVGRRLSSKGFRSCRPSVAGEQVRCWKGIGLAGESGVPFTRTESPDGGRSGYLAPVSG